MVKLYKYSMHDFCEKLPLKSDADKWYYLSKRVAETA